MSFRTMVEKLSIVALAGIVTVAWLTLAVEIPLSVLGVVR
jgi:hypothetical protein